jgi:hypothetical protein
MQGVTIGAKLQLNSGEKRLKGDLEEILSVIGERVLTSRWRCWDLDFILKNDGDWYSNKDKKMKLSGEELVKFAESVGQTIDGRFEARSEGATKHPWLLIVAFDSSWYEVWSSKSWVIERVKEHFKDVTDIPNQL